MLLELQLLSRSKRIDIFLKEQKYNNKNKEYIYDLGEYLNKYSFKKNDYVLDNKNYAYDAARSSAESETPILPPARVNIEPPTSVNIDMQSDLVRKSVKRKIKEEMRSRVVEEPKPKTDEELYWENRELLAMYYYDETIEEMVSQAKERLAEELIAKNVVQNTLRDGSMHKMEVYRHFPKPDIGELRYTPARVGEFNLSAEESAEIEKRNFDFCAVTDALCYVVRYELQKCIEESIPNAADGNAWMRPSYSTTGIQRHKDKVRDKYEDDARQRGISIFQLGIVASMLMTLVLSIAVPAGLVGSAAAISLIVPIVMMLISHHLGDLSATRTIKAEITNRKHDCNISDIQHVLHMNIRQSALRAYQEQVHLAATEQLQQPEVELINHYTGIPEIDEEWERIVECEPALYP